MQSIRFVILAQMVGWVKRAIGTNYVGFAYLNETRQSEVASKLVNPTRSVAGHGLNPTYDLLYKLRKWIIPVEIFFYHRKVFCGCQPKMMIGHLP